MYEHVSYNLCAPSPELVIYSPVAITIALEDIKQVIRSPGSSEMSDSDAEEVRTMFLNFEIAFSEEKDAYQVSSVGAPFIASPTAVSLLPPAETTSCLYNPLRPFCD